MAEDTSLSEAVLTALRSGQFSTETLNEFVDVITELQTIGVRPVRVFPKGLPADGVWLEVDVPVEAAPKLLEALAAKPRLEETRFFPKGLPAFEGFSARVGIR